MNCTCVGGTGAFLDQMASLLNSELLINSTINEVTKNKICIIIAHRLSTIRNCNKVIFMDNKSFEHFVYLKGTR